jgi:superfamily I DNA and/or RNA helicase
MIRTGSKEFRQELKGKFNELILDSERKSYVGHNLKSINALWKAVIKKRVLLEKIDSLERKFEEFYLCSINICEKSGVFSGLLSLVRKLLEFIKFWLVKMQLERLPVRSAVEKEITKLQCDFYNLSRSYIKGIYVDKMLGKGRNVGRVKTFLHEVDSRRPTEGSIDKYLFHNALDVLKIWSCTLKSVRATFPITAGIFDYVIFDEASQVDLPSAAPALYRAKRAVVVGDPMQLTHIAGITRDIDKGIAIVHGLDSERDIYPSRIRYCDVSIYRSAEHSLTQKPILLANHYRSEDQIITLCNKAFYEGQLKIRTALDYSKYPENLPVGVHWIDCQGQCSKHPGGSRINQDEASLANRVFQDVLKKISNTNLSIGIVTPYSRQEDIIGEEILKSTPEELVEKHSVKILTAHKFQGSEKDIMIFSLVLASRGNANSDRWYNIYPQILNVALSRAKYLLYIIGDKKFCHSRPGVLSRLVETYEEIKKQATMEEYTLKEKFDSYAERHLFEKLKNVDFNSLGYKLETQRVVKRYTLDFAITGTSRDKKQKKKINVECDGYQHEIIEGLPVIEDVARDEFLEKEGWMILRFPNHKILSDTNAVITKILDFLRD